MAHERLFLLVKAEEQVRFRCELFTDKKNLKSLLNQANKNLDVAINHLHRFFWEKVKQARIN